MMLTRFLTMLLLGGLALSSAESVAAAPRPPPRFWGVSRCERTLHMFELGGVTVDGHGFHNGPVICVGNGGPSACRWTVAHRARLYSQFTVFARSRYVAGVVRSFTLAEPSRTPSVTSWLVESSFASPPPERGWARASLR
jgi:hypothetical protein